MPSTKASPETVRQTDVDRPVSLRKTDTPAVLVNPDDLEGLEETIEILEDKEFMRTLKGSLKESAEGKTTKLKDHFPRAI